MKKRPSFKRKSFKKRKPIFKKRWFFRFLLINLFFSLLFYFLFLSEIFEIKKVEIEEKNNFSLREINFIQNLFLGQNLFLLQKGKFSFLIQRSFPQFKKVKIKRVFPSSVSLVFEKRERAGTFCFKKRCFFLSKEGVIFEKTKKKILPIFEIFPLPKKIWLGKEIISAENMEKLLSLKRGLKEFLNLSIKKVRLEPFEIKIETKKGFWIIFSSQNNLKTQLLTLIEIYQKVLKPSEREKLHYIDLSEVKEGRRSEVFWK